MDGRTSNPLLAPRVVSSGRDVGEGKGRREGTTGFIEIRTTYGEEWGRGEVGGDGGESTGYTAGREVVVQCVYGVREG